MASHIRYGDITKSDGYILLPTFRLPFLIFVKYDDDSRYTVAVEEQTSWQSPCIYQQVTIIDNHGQKHGPYTISSTQAHLGGTTYCNSPPYNNGLPRSIYEPFQIHIKCTITSVPLPHTIIDFIKGGQDLVALATIITQKDDLITSLQNQLQTSNTHVHSNNPTCNDLPVPIS